MILPGNESEQLDFKTEMSFRLRKEILQKTSQDSIPQNESRIFGFVDAV